MAKVGTFGEIRFAVSDERVLTFGSLKQQVSADWSGMDRIGKKSLSFLSGPALRTITFTVVLDAGLGAPPREILEDMEEMVENGDAQYLIVGKNQVGRHRWVITKVSETWDAVMAKGELYRASVDLTLQEYV